MMLPNPLAALEYLQIKVYQWKTNQAIFTQYFLNFVHHVRQESIQLCDKGLALRIFSIIL